MSPGDLGYAGRRSAPTAAVRLLQSTLVRYGTTGSRPSRAVLRLSWGLCPVWPYPQFWKLRVVRRLRITQA